MVKYRTQGRYNAVAVAVAQEVATPNPGQSVHIEFISFEQAN